MVTIRDIQINEKFPNGGAGAGQYGCMSIFPKLNVQFVPEPIGKSPVTKSEGLEVPTVPPSHNLIFKNDKQFNLTPARLPRSRYQRTLL
jgi:hypothetical protein